jgi:hypothetical protein
VLALAQLSYLPVKHRVKSTIFGENPIADAKMEMRMESIEVIAPSMERNNDPWLRLLEFLTAVAMGLDVVGHMAANDPMNVSRKTS